MTNAFRSITQQFLDNRDKANAAKKLGTIKKDGSLDPKDKRAVQIEREHGIGLKPGTIKKAIDFVLKAPKSHPEFWSERHLHTAKNPQTCTHCKEPINVGQQYYRWKWPDRDTIRVHEHHRFEGNLVKSEYVDYLRERLGQPKDSEKAGFGRREIKKPVEGQSLVPPFKQKASDRVRPQYEATGMMPDDPEVGKTFGSGGKIARKTAAWKKTPEGQKIATPKSSGSAREDFLRSIGLVSRDVKKGVVGKQCKCGAAMSQGAPHVGGNVRQWECHKCGHVEVEPATA